MSERTRFKAFYRVDTGRAREHPEGTAIVAAISDAGDARALDLWLVADGVRGGPGGDVTSAITCDETVAALRATNDRTDPGRALASRSSLRGRPSSTPNPSHRAVHGRRARPARRRPVRASWACELLEPARRTEAPAPEVTR